MTVDNIDVEATIKSVQELLAQEPNLSPALRSTLDVLLVVVKLLVNRLSLNSRNSSKPPSSDPNRDRNNQSKEGSKKRGGQTGSIGSTLRKVDDPDEIKRLEVDRSMLPQGYYREVGFESRQVFDIDISRIVTEYRAQILENEQGNALLLIFQRKLPKLYNMAME